MKARSKTRNRNRKKRSETCKKDGLAPWSDLSHDVLLLVMMQLSGVVDFLSLSGVCKSWRSLALSNINKFIVSKPFMSIRISTASDEKDYYCYLEELEERRLKIILPRSAGMTFIGFTCGYMVLFGGKTREFWLVNPITRQELYFVDVPSFENVYLTRTSAILLYSPSINGLVLVVSYAYTKTIWFSVVGTLAWNHVTSTFFIKDLHFFKGKIYALVSVCGLCELRLDPEPKLTLLEVKNSLNPFCYMGLVTLGENLCVVGFNSGYPHEEVVQKLDFEEMKWMSPEKIIGEYGLFVGDFKNDDPFKPESESWADPQSQYERYASFNENIDKSRKRSLML